MAPLPEHIFEGVVFFLNDDLSPELLATLKELLQTAGAQCWEDSAGEINKAFPRSYRFNPEKVTHVITSTLDFPEYEACIDPQADNVFNIAADSHAVVVDPEWVQRSYTLGERQPERFYSPDAARIFSGVVIHASRMPKLEVELIMGAVQSLGGSYKLNLTKEVTHLITPSEDSSKLSVLREPQNRQLGICAVHPSWIDESVKFNRLVDTAPFAWPLDRAGKPPLLANSTRVPPYTLTAGPTNGQGEAAATGGRRAERSPFMDVIASIYSANNLFKEDSPDQAAAADGGGSSTSAMPSQRKPGSASARLYKHKHVLQGKRVLYAKNPREKLSGRALDLLSYKVHEHGGVWIPPPSDDRSIEQAVRNADVVVAQYRDLPAAYYAFYHGKQLASLAWLWSVMTSGRLVSPLDSLLHFPPPSKPIRGFDKHVITISNYTGENRAYLKLLLNAMGARWTPEMSIKNTHCVSATLSGDKVLKAAEWNIPIVNHLWLEDCFARWQDVPHGDATYVDYSPGVNMQKLVGGARLDTDLLRPWAVQAEEYTRRRGRSLRAQQPDLYNVQEIVDAAAEAAEAYARTPAAAGQGADGMNVSAGEVCIAVGQPEAFENGDAETVNKKTYPGEGDGEEEEEDGAEAEPVRSPSRTKQRGGARTASLKKVPAKATRERRSAHAESDDDEQDDRLAAEIVAAAPKPRRSAAGGPKSRGRASAAAEAPAAKSAKPVARGRGAAKNVQDRDQDEDEVDGSRFSERDADKDNEDVMNEMEHDRLPASAPKKRGHLSEASSTAGASEDALAASDPPAKKRARASGVESSGNTSGPVRFYTTTGVDLSATDVKSLARFGWTKTDGMTGKVELLVASQLQRTEKMLCAIARGLPVVNEEWVLDSARSGQEQDPEKYILKDKEGEKSRGMVLANALKASRENPHGLLHGHTFYFTRNTKPAVSVLRNIVISAGGEAPDRGSINVDFLLPNPKTSHLISVKEDKKIWSAIMTDRCVDGSKVRVWEPELILEGVLKQKMDWSKHQLHG